MTAITPDILLGIFLIFCRIGGCLMIVPGFSSLRVPMQVRLFIALAATLAVSPLVLDKARTGVASQAPAVVLLYILSETATGLTIGLLGRIYFWALQTMATAVAMAIGMGGMAGAPVDETEPLPAISSLIMMVASAVLFLSDMHWELFRGLIESYSRIPLGEGFGAQLSLVQVTDQAVAAFAIALRISAPFIIYSVVVNLAVGLTNKLTPQIPVFFIATPFVMLGGLLLIYFLVKDYVLLFIDAFSTWLSHG